MEDISAVPGGEFRAEEPPPPPATCFSWPAQPLNSSLNLVKLIGICTEERSRCLVYELIPNGSVESHLHGDDRVTAPLDWGSRVKIALGAARGLAYLHEDSSPRVIHRDFKSSNILLEHDFTPKVSDFGLARTALDEENRHISTRVMGTFGLTLNGVSCSSTLGY